MLHRMNLLVVLSLFLALTTGCFHQNVSSSGGGDDGDGKRNGNWALNEVAPQWIKANHVGPVTLTGIGFEPTTEVAFGGLLTQDSARLGVSYISDTEMELTFADLGNANAGQEMVAGDYDVSALNGNSLIGEQPLHVYPNLDRLEYVRTIPEFFRTDGGFMEVWVQPVDTEELVMLPWHEVPAFVTGDFSPANFTYSNVVLTNLSTGSTVSPTVNLEEVLYGPRFTGTNTAFAMAIDNSGSMDNNDPDGIRFTAGQAFIDKMSPSSTLETLTFAGNVTVETAFTTDKVALKAGLDDVKSRGTGGGGTALWDGLLQGLADLDALGNTVDHRVVIGLTDGQDSGSNGIPQDVIDAANAVGAQIFIIGLGQGNNLAADDLINIADMTDGSFFLADNADALPAIFDQLGNFQADSYRLVTQLTFNPPVNDTGEYSVSMDITANIDGEIRTQKVTGASVFVSDF